MCIRRSIDNLGSGGVAGGGLTSDVMTPDRVGDSTGSLSAVRCCPVGGWPDDYEVDPAGAGGARRPQDENAAELGCSRLDVLDTAVDEARARLAAVTARLAMLRADAETTTVSRGECSTSSSRRRRSPVEPTYRGEIGPSLDDDSMSWTMDACSLDAPGSIPDDRLSDSSCSSSSHGQLSESAAESLGQSWPRAHPTPDLATALALHACCTKDALL